jgi:hypothetical protein
VEKEEQLRVMV